MVIGNGMIARRFAAYADNDVYAIFASGVSDSRNIDPAVFQREVALLLHTINHYPEKKLVYFSTCGIYDQALSASPYVLHKLHIEKIIKENCEKYCVFRVSNPIGVTENTHTVLNYFVNSIKNKIPFEVWLEAHRNLIDLDDMYELCQQVLNRFTTDTQMVNIANPKNYAVTDIVTVIENHLSEKAICSLIHKVSHPIIDVQPIKPLIRELNIQFGSGYLQMLLQKYFPVTGIRY